MLIILLRIKMFLKVRCNHIKKLLDKSINEKRFKGKIGESFFCSVGIDILFEFREQLFAFI